MAKCYQSAGERFLLDIKAVPGASRTEFSGIKDSRVRIRIAAAPEDGKANGELIAFLAKKLGCAKSEIILYSGEKSRQKTLSLPAAVLEKLRQNIDFTKE